MKKNPKQKKKDKSKTFWLLGDVVIVSGATNNGNKSNCHAYHLYPVTLRKFHFLRSGIFSNDDKWVLLSSFGRKLIIGFWSKWLQLAMMKIYMPCSNNTSCLLACVRHLSLASSFILFSLNGFY